MKNNLLTFALLGAAALMMGGCQTSRTASFPNHDYNTVFKGAVNGLCSEKKLLVYKADKQKGIIWLQGRGMFANPPETPVYLTKAHDGSANASVTIQGMNNPWADRIMNLISDGLPAQKQGVSKSRGKKSLDEGSDTDLERQQLELEREKLKLEKEKFEFEKQKRKTRKPQPKPEPEPEPEPAADEEPVE
ncbi:MAG: hypothetical protein HY550_11580 [Elusimicrobia bacterium]|nr:hypothetical protein [Elusimicrobiota bacterium]